jgi:hypothetical protein
MQTVAVGVKRNISGLCAVSRAPRHHTVCATELELSKSRESTKYVALNLKEIFVLFCFLDVQQNGFFCFFPSEQQASAAARQSIRADAGDPLGLSPLLLASFYSTYVALAGSLYRGADVPAAFCTCDYCSL